MLILLHGKGSSPKISETVKGIKNHKQLKNELIFTPHYDSDLNYDHIKKNLINYVEELKKQYPDERLIFVGTSLGGFWAKHLANHYKDSAILINPALKFYGGIEPDHPDVSLTIFLGTNDDVVDHKIALNHYKDRASIYINDSGHRMLDYFDEIVKEILFIGSLLI